MTKLIKSTKFTSYDKFVTCILGCVCFIWKHVLKLMEMSNVDKSSLSWQKLTGFLYTAESPWLSLKTRILCHFLYEVKVKVIMSRIKKNPKLKYYCLQRSSTRCKELLLASDQRNSHGKVTSINFISSHLCDYKNAYTASLWCIVAKTVCIIYRKYYWQCLNMKV